MKLPRNVSGEKLLGVLKTLGYVEVRQKGSHVRLQHPGPPTHSLTVAKHDALKVGTLSAILDAVANERGISVEEILEAL